MPCGKDLENGIKGLKNEKFPHQIYNNCLPHIDVFLENDYTKEEEKMINERRILYEACMRSTVLTGIYRHLLISDFSTSIAQLPREVLQDMVAGDGGNFHAFDRVERPVVRAPTNNILRLC